MLAGFLGTWQEIRKPAADDDEISYHTFIGTKLAQNTYFSLGSFDKPKPKAAAPLRFNLSGEVDLHYDHEQTEACYPGCEKCDGPEQDDCTRCWDGSRPWHNEDGVCELDWSCP